MFAVTPYIAKCLIFSKAGEEWKPCRVIGIDASGDDPQYIVERYDRTGAAFLEKVEMIRKDQPTAKG